ncbi:hypothetical protein [Halobacillus sp. Marseille-P3879]|uniref:hypothetical protein n=1 Tax=Halobacillus sp. Marseille-P3879 TaxID=2045014 RepID=UPI0011AF9D8D|nr:hypothetical protein [Halobacillus sp. Marseille-P3879]
MKETWSKIKKTCSKTKVKTLKKSKNTVEFVTDNVEDVLIFLGLLLIVVATLISFGIAPALYVAGVFMVLVGLGFLDSNILARGGR